MPNFKKKVSPEDQNLYIRTRAYKTKLRPTQEQIGLFVKASNAARYAYNWALHDRDTAWKERQERVSYAEQKSRFNALKRTECPWIMESPYVVVESAFMQIDDAYKNFFRRVRTGENPGYPKYRRRDAPCRFTLRGTFYVERDRVKLPVLGWVDLAEPDYIPKSPYEIVDATVSCSAEKWYISVLVKEVIPPPERPEGEPMGIDFGYGYLATTSDGEKFHNPKIFERNERKLAKLQRKLSRQQRGSKNRSKTKSKIAKLHDRIARTRSHHLHDVSRAIADQGHSIIAVQKLAVQEMMQDDSQSSRKAKRAKRLADASPYELRRQIEYKQQWNGGEVRTGESDQATNRRCSTCGHINAVVPISKEEFTCESCGTVHDRRVNGAKNALYYVGL